MVSLEKGGHWGSELIPVSSASCLPQGEQFWPYALVLVFSLIVGPESVVPSTISSLSCGGKEILPPFTLFPLLQKAKTFFFSLSSLNSYWMSVTCVTSLPRHTHPWIQKEMVFAQSAHWVSGGVPKWDLRQVLTEQFTMAFLLFLPRCSIFIPAAGIQYFNKKQPKG